MCSRFTENGFTGKDAYMFSEMTEQLKDNCITVSRFLHIDIHASPSHSVCNSVPKHVKGTAHNKINMSCFYFIQTGFEGQIS